MSKGQVNTKSRKKENRCRARVAERENDDGGKRGRELEGKELRDDRK